MDEENLIKVLFGFIIVLIFVFILTIFLMYFSFERESIMCPYCQQIYKIKYATEVGRVPATSNSSRIYPMAPATMRYIK